MYNAATIAAADEISCKTTEAQCNQRRPKKYRELVCYKCCLHNIKTCVNMLYYDFMGKHNINCHVNISGYLRDLGTPST